MCMQYGTVKFSLKLAQPRIHSWPITKIQGWIDAFVTRPVVVQNRLKIKGKDKHLTAVRRC